MADAVSFEETLTTRGGDAGRLIASRDWTASLGPIGAWPQCLKTSLSLLLASPVPLVMLWGEDGIMLYNDAYSVFAGGRHPELLGSKVREGWPEVADFNDNVMKVGLAGGTLQYKDQELTLHRHGRPEQVWMNLDYSPVLDEAGQPAGVIAVVVETSERVQADRRLRAETDALVALNRTAAITATERNLESVVQAVTDAGVALTGAGFGAFFYNIENAAGESYMLYTLSGAPRSAFEKFPMPRNTAVFAPTFAGEGVVRSDDITQDPRYGHNAPGKGMPDGHLPVTSYLAVPVRSQMGEVLGGLFFGHAEAARFAESHERWVVGLAAQAAIAIDNARLFAAVQGAKETLERSVEERTRELTVAHEALRQAQKMEAVGQLTGGIAHDFNNLLMGISGSLEMIEHKLARQGVAGMERYIEGAQTSARRAAALTQRLLAFSRRQTLDPKPTDINRLIRDMHDLIGRTVGPSITVDVAGPGDLWAARIDAAQLESTLLNLAINARDAMPNGGRITIETANVRLDARAAAERELAGGPYVQIRVADNGSGIAPEIIDRIFDPFFTTKPMGEGTGLGLSMVHGFVRQSGGQVRVASQPGRGTAFTLYLPRYRGAVEDAAAETAAAPEDASGETVLVIDDEATVRMLMADVLAEAGYRVLQAADGPQGLAVLQNEPRIDMLVTDVGMPGGMNGRQVADAARQQRPGLKVLFVTGFAETAAVGDGRLPPGMAVITKPFQVADFAAKVEEILEI